MAAISVKLNNLFDYNMFASSFWLSVWLVIKCCRRLLIFIRLFIRIRSIRQIFILLKFIWEVIIICITRICAWDRNWFVGMWLTSYWGFLWLIAGATLVIIIRFILLLNSFNFFDRSSNYFSSPVVLYLFLFCIFFRFWLRACLTLSCRWVFSWFVVVLIWTKIKSWESVHIILCCVIKTKDSWWCHLWIFSW